MSPQEPASRFTMPVSPSTNNLFVERRDGKGRAATTAYKAWQESAGWHVKLQHPKAVAGRVAVRIEAPFDRRRDLDNCKPALDMLVKLCLIDDDRWIDDLRIVRVAPGPLMTISIWPIA